MLSCQQNETLFSLIEPGHSGVHFSNRIIESDSLNILEYEYIYNGGGVGLGDFNNDGLDDIFLAGNIVANELYINKGDFQFQDISAVSGIQIYDRWSSGVAVLDINNDGWQDIYVCNTTSKVPDQRKNSLFVNQGLNEEGVPTFKDLAAEYGLDDNSYSVNSAFFDYDQDGDLDVIIIVNEMGDTRYHSQYRDPGTRDYYQRVDHLYEQTKLENGQPFFVDVSEKAGITLPGFSLGVNINDINQDGWKDIYISNDFLSDDLIYVNQKNGTFKEVAQQLLKHTSHSAMGNDVVDINNDGLDDILALDMLPEDNYRQKRLLGETNYNSYLNNERFGYSYQYVRNTLQLNNGFSDSLNTQFSEIALYSGISATDWSWTPLVADFDNDGFRDVIITNGFPRDVTDHDFIDFKADAFTYASKEMMLQQIPSIKLHNYGYRNNGDLTFDDFTVNWGLERPSYSSGAAYSDLDNDGDLDFVVNNINDSLFIYQNNSATGNVITVQLRGPQDNKDAIGSRLNLYTTSGCLGYEHSVFRGYLSSNSKAIHLSWSPADSLEYLEVIWPDQTKSKILPEELSANMTLDYNDLEKVSSTERNVVLESRFEMDMDFQFEHIEEDFIDYNIQPLLPHKLSQYGPSISIGDIDNNGLDDIYIGGSAFFNGYFIKQQEDGELIIDSLNHNLARAEEQGALIFDADKDGFNDIFIATGSYEFSEEDTILRDLFFHSKNGRLKLSEEALPEYLSNATNIAGADYDRDGDIDIFISGRVVSGAYPASPSSYLLENDSKPGAPSFKFSSAIDLLDEIGMITDALWTDYNNDQWVDLILTRELDEIVFFKNENGRFIRDTPVSLQGKKGFWNSVASCDLDRDGDMDYVFGNIGKNTYMEISDEYPYRIYVNDFDDNGSVDALPFAFYKDREGEIREFPTVSRMDFAKEINSVRKLWPSYKLYAQADVNEFITEATMKETDVFEANFSSSIILWNEQGTFSIQNLPDPAQLAPLYGVVCLDVNEDGVTDIIATGNDFGAELVFGRMDALNGVVLYGQNDRSYRAANVNPSGFYTPGDGKSLALFNYNNQLSVIAGENKGAIKKVDLSASQLLKVDADVQRVIFEVDERTWAEEVHYGGGFLSQHSRVVLLPSRIDKVRVVKYNGDISDIEIKD